MEPCIKEGDIAALHADIKGIFKRMDEQLTISKAVYDLVAEIKVMNIELKNLNTRIEALEGTQKETKMDLKKDIEGIKSEVEELKAQPGRKWNSVISTVITALVSGLIAYLLFRLGLK